MKQKIGSLVLGKRERAAIEEFIRTEFNEKPREKYVQEWAQYFRAMNMVVRRRRK